MLIYYVLLLRLAGATLMEEIRGEWRLELRPRLIADNIQPFEGALGDLEASAVICGQDTLGCRC